jgi:triacylglycerol lipase
MKVTADLNWQIEGPLHAKQTFLLLHGIAGSHKLWGPLPNLLASAGYRVLTPDLPGFGESAPIPADEPILMASADRLARDLPTFTDQKVILVGHSYGGGIGVEFARRYPDLVSSIVLVAPGGFFLRQLPGKRAWRFPELQLLQRIGALAAGPVVSKTAPLRRIVISRFVYRHWQLSSKQVGYLIKDIARAKSTGRAGMAIVYADLWQYCEELDIPTWLIWGEKDQIINPKCSKRLEKELPNLVDSFSYLDVGHLPQFEDPIRLVQDLKAIANHSHDADKKR